MWETVRSLGSDHEYFGQQLQDAFIEAGIEGRASINHTRSEIPHAAVYRQTTSRGFEEGVGRDLRELRETSLPVWAEVARGQGSETSDDIFAALEGLTSRFLPSLLRNTNQHYHLQPRPAGLLRLAGVYPGRSSYGCRSEVAGSEP